MSIEDFYGDGFNTGYGYGYRNDGHSMPQTDGDQYSYRRGQEDGARRRRISDELEREGY